MRILLATDGSIEAELAEAVVQKLPLGRNSTFSVAMVTNVAPLLMAGAIRAPFPSVADGAAESYRIQRDVARQTVNRVADRIHKAGYAAEGSVLEGETADELVSFADKEQCELVVSGSGVSGEFAAFFLGSVSRMLALNSRASVLIGRHYGDAPAEGSYQRIKNKSKLDVLIAVDGSPGSQIVIDSLSGLRDSVFGTVTVLVVEPLRDFAAPAEYGLIPVMDANEGWGTEIATLVSNRIAGCCEHRKWEVGFGRPSVEIARVATQNKVDLVMLGANRHGVLERLLLGSCAYETATSAPCSVLILRNKLSFTDGDAK